MPPAAESRPFTLETPRLAMRELQASDLDFLTVMLGDTEVMRHYPKALTRDEARGWLERQQARYAADGHGLWLVIERASGAPVGQVGLLMQRVEAFGGVVRPEIGYLLHRPYWRRGYATEAALEVRSYAFVHRRYPAVISLIRAENTASQAVARRLGMRAVAETVHAGLPHLVYEISAAEIDAAAPSVPEPRGPRRLPPLPFTPFALRVRMP